MPKEALPSGSAQGPGPMGSGAAAATRAGLRAAYCRGSGERKCRSPMVLGGA